MQTIEHLAQGCNYPGQNLTNTTLGCIPTSIWNRQSPNTSNINFDVTNNYVFNNNKNHICTYAKSTTTNNLTTPEIKGLVGAAIDISGNKSNNVNCVNLIPESLKNSINQTQTEIINNYKVGYQVTYKNNTNKPVSLSLPQNCPSDFKYNNGSIMDIPVGCYKNISNDDYADISFICPPNSNKNRGTLIGTNYYCY
jgi:hypothetical protein